MIESYLLYEEICRDFVIFDSYKRSAKVAIFSCYQFIGPLTRGMLCSKLKSVVTKFVCTVNKIKITFEFKLFSPFMEKDFGNIYTSNPLFSMKLAFVPNFPLFPPPPPPLPPPPPPPTIPKKKIFFFHLHTPDLFPLSSKLQKTVSRTVFLLLFNFKKLIIKNKMTQRSSSRSLPGRNCNLFHPRLDSHMNTCLHSSIVCYPLVPPGNQYHIIKLNVSLMLTAAVRREMQRWKWAELQFYRSDVLSLKLSSSTEA